MTSRITKLFLSVVLSSIAAEAAETALPQVQDAQLQIALFASEPQIVTIAAEKIIAARPSQISLMPDGLENSMTVRDFRDLLAFLLSLK